MKESPAIKILKNKKLSSTKFRIQLVELLLQHNRTVSFKEISQEFKDADRITIYRNLKKLSLKGVIHSTVFNQEEYFALCSHQCCENEHIHDHVHFKCLKCNEVSCVDLLQKINVQLHAHHIQTVHMNVQGICQHCL